MTRTDGLIRYVSTMFRRYSRDPATRTNSSRLMMTALIALCAEHNGLGETGLMVAEALAGLKAEERQEQGSREKTGGAR